MRSCLECTKLISPRSTFCKSCSKRGIRNPMFGNQPNAGSFKKGLVPWNKGKKGLTSWNKGLTKELDSRLDYIRPTTFKDQGRCDENMRIRKSRQSLLWRKAVFERDNYICVWCGQRGGQLNADHIKPLAGYPELIFEISNGRTLCIGCHKKTDNYAGRGRSKW